jgi:outer membrane protein OmpA-like peptidoglycan-associated protein
MNASRSIQQRVKTGCRARMGQRGWQARLPGPVLAALSLAMLSGCAGSAASSRSPASEVGANAPSAEKVDLRDVEFTRIGSLRPSSKPVLDAVSALLKAEPDAKVYVDAYCDPTGGPQLNQQLSGERAAVVKAYLVERGVSADRLVARGLGATNFIASNATADGRRQNRRIELVVVRS